MLALNLLLISDRKPSSIDYLIVYFTFFLKNTNLILHVTQNTNCRAYCTSKPTRSAPGW